MKQSFVLESRSILEEILSSGRFALLKAFDNIPPTIKNWRSMSTIEKIENAGSNGDLLESTVKNLIAWARADYLPEWVGASIDELVEQGAWEELNDRFYRELA